MTTQYWLMKSEPDEASIDHLAAAPQQSLQIGRAHV
jgi:predicted RNA-binding protein with PUA-like domain